MKIEDVLKLTDAGFTKEEIVKLMKAETQPAKKEETKQEETKQEETKQEETKQEDNKVLSAIDELNKNITALFINTSSVSSGTGTVEDFLANIINPTEEGGK